MMNVDLAALSDAQRYLVQFLSADSHKVICPFLREHGRFFEPSPLPKGIRSGKIAVCFANSYRLLKRYGKARGLVYVEGYAVSNHVMQAHLHAWCADPHGNVYDRTWGIGQAYFGVAFKTAFVMSEIRRRRKSGDLYFGFLDDWDHRWPVIRQLADRPDVWKHEWKQSEK